MENEKGLHPRNIHISNYDFDALTKANPKLAAFIKTNQYNNLGVDYTNRNAVLALNKALIILHYKVKNWDILKGHLCPPIPGRADYIHYIADLISDDEDIPVGKSIKGLDIGTGSSCIYPILGNSIYGWKFVGSDIDSDATNHAGIILNSNPKLKKNIKIRYQDSQKSIFKGVIKFDEYFDFSMCNPPFYSSLDEAKKNSARKNKNLNFNKEKKGHESNNLNKSNFGGVHNELWCTGGEITFIKNMISESETYKEQVGWFTTLVSNKDHLPQLNKFLMELTDVEVHTIEMNQGNKNSHILAWRFKLESERETE